jgi:hypothetical protein
MLNLKSNWNCLEKEKNTHHIKSNIINSNHMQRTYKILVQTRYKCTWFLSGLFLRRVLGDCCLPSSFTVNHSGKYFPQHQHQVNWNSMMNIICRQISRDCKILLLRYSTVQYRTRIRTILLCCMHNPISERQCLQFFFAWCIT